MNVVLESLIAALAIGLVAGCTASAGPTSVHPKSRDAQNEVKADGIADWRREAERMRRVREQPPSGMLETFVVLDEATTVTRGFFRPIRLTTYSTAHELHTLSTWLRWAIVAAGADGRYSYVYAANLSYLMDEAGKPFTFESALFLAHARTALEVDGARCADPSSPEALRRLFESMPYYRRAVEAFDAMSAWDQTRAMVGALALEESVGERLPNAGICSIGPKTAAMFARGPAQGAGPITRGRNHPENPSEVIEPFWTHADFIASDDWRKARRQILDGYWDRLTPPK